MATRFICITVRRIRASRSPPAPCTRYSNGSNNTRDETEDQMSARVERKTSPSPPTAALMVAHPDDETLWAGGFVLEHAEWDWFIGTLCRASDPDRAPKFARVLERLHAHGAMLDMEDGSEQRPLPALDVQRQLLTLLPKI